MNDKMQRLIRLVWEERADLIPDEYIEDTYFDLANYVLIALLIRRKE